MFSFWNNKSCRFAYNLSCYFYIFSYVFLIHDAYICAQISLSKYSSISCLYVLLISFFLMVYSLTYLGIISCLFYIIVTSHYYARLEGTRHTKEKRKQEIIFKVGLIKNIAKYILMQCIIIFIVTTLVSLVVGVPSVLQT